MFRSAQEVVWAYRVGQDPSASKSNRLHVHIFRFGCFHSFDVYYVDSSRMIGKSLEVFNFNRLFLKLNRFICNQPPVLSRTLVPSSMTYLNQPRVFEWYVVGCGSKNKYQKIHIYERDWTMHAKTMITFMGLIVHKFAAGGGGKGTYIWGRRQPWFEG